VRLPKHLPTAFVAAIAIVLCCSCVLLQRAVWPTTVAAAVAAILAAFTGAGLAWALLWGGLGGLLGHAVTRLNEPDAGSVTVNGNATFYQGVRATGWAFSTWLWIAALALVALWLFVPRTRAHFLGALYALLKLHPLAALAKFAAMLGIVRSETADRSLLRARQRRGKGAPRAALAPTPRERAAPRAPAGA
jgi:hypothetical protein